MCVVAGALFVAFPVSRIVLEPPEPLVAVAALAATALFAFLIVAVARSEPDDLRRARIGFAVADVAIIALAVVTIANSPIRAGSCSSTTRPARQACCSRNVARSR